MKRTFLALLLLVAVLFSFTACSAADSGGTYGEGAPAGGADAESGDESIYSDAVVKNASVFAETKEFDSAVGSLTSLISAQGGYIYSSSVTKNPSYGSVADSEREADYVIKIPSKNLDAFIDGLDGFLNVTSLETFVRDVSDELYDLEASLKTLEGKRDTLRTMLDGVDSSTQWNYYWQISNELDSVEQQIARINSELSSLESNISYSTVSMTVYEVVVLSEAGEPGFGEQIKDAFASSWTALLEMLQALLIVVIFLLPFSIFGGLIAFLIVFTVKKSKKRRRARKAAQNEQAAPPSPYSGYGPYNQ